MKIRIKGNSLRYRLTKSEVEKLFTDGKLEERTQFTGKTLVYAIETGKEERLSADFAGDKIVLRMSKMMMEDLYYTGRIGFDDRSGPVNLLIEKDFVCIDNTDEDQSDNYPNPSVEC